MKNHIDLQNVCDFDLKISQDEIFSWVNRTLDMNNRHGELSLRFVEYEEIQALNKSYRFKDNPTNVLAFPANLPSYVDLNMPLLGDVIVCLSVVQEESITLKQQFKEHFAHIIVHGVLHLLGFDHIKNKDAKIMQDIEIKILDSLGFSNPYLREEY